jgi:hypothetical protein
MPTTTYKGVPIMAKVTLEDAIKQYRNMVDKVITDPMSVSTAYLNSIRKQWTAYKDMFGDDFVNAIRHNETDITKYLQHMWNVSLKIRKRGRELMDDNHEEMLEEVSEVSEQ